MPLVPVILCGGAGTRLWPVSREAAPKPFMRLPDGQTLLQKTLLRAAALPEAPALTLVTNREYYFRSRDEAAALGKALALPVHCLLEPEGRNTAPAVALAAIHALNAYGDDALLMVLPADHLISDLDAFVDDASEAARVAREGRLVTFGIRPDRPETGFGYVEGGEAIEGTRARAARRFVEKPTLEVAQGFVASGNHYWNSGMFCLGVQAILRAMERHAPEVFERAVETWSHAQARAGAAGQTVEFETESFARLPSISLDYAVMEKADNVALVPARFDWSDIGSWQAVSALTRADEAGNRVVGEAMLVDSRNTYVHSDGRLVATVGVDDLVIVDTPDALLVAHRDRVQDVKEIAGRLKARGHEAYKLHRTVSRPWGTYTTLQEGTRFKIKRIEVKPGASLSLQMHHHRSEHWVVVSGTAKVVNGDKEFLVRTNESTFIPVGTRHRLENPGLLDLVMIEVQSGEYLGEDDIVRYEDRYHRVRDAG